MERAADSLSRLEDGPLQLWLLVFVAELQLPSPLVVFGPAPAFEAGGEEAALGPLCWHLLIVTGCLSSLSDTEAGCPGQWDHLERAVSDWLSSDPGTGPGFD